MSESRAGRSVIASRWASLRVPGSRASATSMSLQRVGSGESLPFTHRLTVAAATPSASARRCCDPLPSIRRASAMTSFTPTTVKGERSPVKELSVVPSRDVITAE